MNLQIEQLNQMIEEQWKGKERPKLVPTEDQDDFFHSKDISNEKYEELLLQTNPTKTEQLNEALDTFYSNQMTQRQAALKEIHKTVKVMMSTSKQESSAQTDDSLMEAYLKTKELEKIKDQETEESLVEQNGEKKGERKKRVRVTNQEPTPGMKKLQAIQANM